MIVLERYLPLEPSHLFSLRGHLSLHLQGSPGLSQNLQTAWSPVTSTSNKPPSPVSIAHHSQFLVPDSLPPLDSGLQGPNLSLPCAQQVAGMLKASVNKRNSNLLRKSVRKLCCVHRILHGRKLLRMEHFYTLMF